METATCTTPVAFFVFCRPETTQKVFHVIAGAKPRRLLIVADGPRKHRPEDEEICRAVRAIVTKVDWPCDVSTNFSRTNLGCGRRMSSGLDWVFSLVEEAIVLEDDCLPDPTFFRFCDEMLERFRDDSRIAAVSGTNLVGPDAAYRSDPENEASYWFSSLGGNWGWATWRKEWQRFDSSISDWPILRREHVLARMFRSRTAIRYWTQVFDDVFEGRLTTAWDYQWLFAHLRNHSLTVVPRLNLVANIGFGGAGATHTVISSPELTPASHPLPFPLRHPSSMVPDRRRDEQFQRIIHGTLVERVVRQLHRSLRNHGLRQAKNEDVRVAAERVETL